MKRGLIPTRSRRYPLFGLLRHNPLEAGLDSDMGLAGFSRWPRGHNPLEAGLDSDSPKVPLEYSINGHNPLEAGLDSDWKAMVTTT